MKLFQPPPPEPLSSTNCHSNNNRLRRRPDLTLPLPLRDSHSDEANRLFFWEKKKSPFLSFGLMMIT
ncbi:hypothetical protein Peur_049590 [Populus x canadensis]